MAPELTFRTLENPNLVLKRLVCSKGSSLAEYFELQHAIGTTDGEHAVRHAQHRKQSVAPSPLPKSSASHVYGDERRGITPIRRTLKAHPALHAARHSKVGVAMRALEMSIGGIMPTISMFYGIIISM